VIRICPAYLVSDELKEQTPRLPKGIDMANHMIKVKKDDSKKATRNIRYKEDDESF